MTVARSGQACEQRRGGRQLLDVSEQQVVQAAKHPRLVGAHELLDVQRVPSRRVMSEASSSGPAARPQRRLTSWRTRRSEPPVDPTRTGLRASSTSAGWSGWPRATPPERKARTVSNGARRRTSARTKSRVDGLAQRRSSTTRTKGATCARPCAASSSASTVGAWRRPPPPLRGVEVRGCHRALTPLLGNVAQSLRDGPEWRSEARSSSGPSRRPARWSETAPPVYRRRRSSRDRRHRRWQPRAAWQVPAGAAHEGIEQHVDETQLRVASEGLRLPKMLPIGDSQRAAAALFVGLPSSRCAAGPRAEALTEAGFSRMWMMALWTRWRWRTPPRARQGGWRVGRRRGSASLSSRSGRAPHSRCCGHHRQGTCDRPEYAHRHGDIDASRPCPTCLRGTTGRFCTVVVGRRKLSSDRRSDPGTVAGMALNPLETLDLLVLVIVPAWILYFVIRLAVRHGATKANRRLGPGQHS